jgi:hypothetical protein
MFGKTNVTGRYSNSLVIDAGSQFSLTVCSQANDLSKFADDIAIIAPVFDYEDSAGDEVENMKLWSNENRMSKLPLRYLLVYTTTFVETLLCR